MNPRRLLTAAGVALAVALLVGQVRQLLADPTVWPPDDFVEYWVAARLTFTGGNPYDPDQLLPLQVAAGRDTDEAIMMWNPPWSLTAVLPLGLLPAREAQLLWLAVNLLAAGWCGARLWLRYGGDPARRWVGWAAALGFVPTLFALQSGQIGPLLLLGAVLFLEAERRGWPALAGAATVLLAIKPHLAYLVWVAIGMTWVTRRDRASTRMLLGGAVAGVLATVVPLLFAPQVLTQYADAMGNRPPEQWVSPTLGTVLRLVFGEGRFGLQFVPVAAGLAWFAWHWRRAGRSWDWAEQLPLLLLLSFVTAPYGAWPFDLVLLLPAVVRLLAGGAPRVVLTGLLAVNLACLAMNVAQTGSFPFLWVAPALLGLYLLGERRGVRMRRLVGPGAVAFVALWLLLLAGGRSSFFRDPGTFWHVTTGDKILADGFLRADPYTFTFGGTWWVPYQWLGEVVMALAHRAGGFDLLLLGACTVLAGTFAVLYARLHATGLNLVVAGVVLLLGLAAAASHFHVRPHLATIAAMAGTMILLVGIDAGRVPVRRFAWLVPAFVVWANVHGGVLAGMGTVGLTVAGWLTLALIGRGPLRSRADVLQACAAAAGCVLSALVNPYGLDLLKTWHVIMGEPALKAIVQEHSALDPAAPYAWPVFALGTLYAAVLVGVPRGELRVSWFLPAVWFVLTLDRVRHAPLFAVAALVVIAAAWPHTRWAAWLARHRPDVYRPRDTGLGFWRNVWLPVVLVVAAAGLHLARVEVPLVGAGWARLDAAHWPVELLPELRAHEPRSTADPHRLFNGYIDGGFVIYHTPGYKVFVDDRCEVFGGDWLLAFVRADSEGTADAVAAWEARYGRFDFALVRAGTGFEAYFRGAPGWELVKQTDVASFYRRTAGVPVSR